MLSQQMKQLQKSINQKLDSSPLSQQMKAAEKYQKQQHLASPYSGGSGNNKKAPINSNHHNSHSHNRSSSKTNAIMQTSSIKPNMRLISDRVISQQQQHPNQRLSQQKQHHQFQSPQKTQEQKKAEQRTFLIKQNQTLKEQTLSLVKQLEDLLATNHKVKKYGINIDSPQESQQVRLKKAEIYKQQIKIASYENKIAYEQKQLQYVWDQKEVNAKESQIKRLQRQFKELEKEKKCLQGILKEQNKQIENNQMTPEFKMKFTQTKEQLDKLKEECKILHARTLQNERLLRKKHEKAVGKQTKIKKLEKLIKENQDKIKKNPSSIDQKVVTVDMIAEIEAQIGELQEQRLLNEKSWNQKLNNLDSELDLRKLEEERKEIILKDKDREVRLNDLRIKELKKLASQQQQAQKQATFNHLKKRNSFSGDQGVNNNNQGQGSTTGRQRNIKKMERRESRDRISESAEENINTVNESNSNDNDNDKNDENNTELPYIV